MIVGYHCIFSTYGFWLPNDPRGSWSQFVASWDLFCAGGSATKVDTRRSVAAARLTPDDLQRKKKARHTLVHKPVAFTGIQARAVGMAFSAVCAVKRYRVHACAIMPRHIHLFVGRTATDIRTVIGDFKRFSTMELYRQNLHPAQHGQRKGAPVWARGSWCVYLHADDVQRVIQYINENPLREGLPTQRWSCVTPWPGENLSPGDTTPSQQIRGGPMPPG
ncbi:MAG: transposase [Phycisphaerae bacterium]